MASGSYATSVDPPDTIMVPSGLFQLTLSGPAEDNDVSGDLDVFRSMNIVGTGNPTIQQTVAGNRVLDVSATGKDLSLAGLTITGGDQTSSDGGGSTSGVVPAPPASPSTVSRSPATTSTPPATGGASTPIARRRSPTARSTTTTPTSSRPVSTGNGGGIYSDGFTDSFTGVTLSIDHSIVTGNSAGDAVNFGSGGGIFRATKATDGTSSAVIQDSDISGNNAHFFGGGIDTHSDATLDVKGSLLSGNRAFVLRGGGMEADASTASQGGNAESRQYDGHGQPGQRRRRRGSRGRRRQGQRQPALLHPRPATLEIREASWPWMASSVPSLPTRSRERCSLQLIPPR